MWNAQAAEQLSRVLFVFVELWLLNADTLLVSSKTSVSGSAFIPSEDISYNEHKSYCASNVVKVLYLPCVTSNHRDIVDAWEKDIGVHSLPLPVTTCQELLLLLSASTGSLPPSMRTMNTFQVSLTVLYLNIMGFSWLLALRSIHSTTSVKQ
ncbi:UNVERIFIED_CONTAM: hypothetical protein FKN15_072099 [Acipenser sinensis]